VIVPVYNRAGLFKRSLVKYGQQTYPNWELVVVDDGSQEDIQGVLSQYASLDIRYIRLNKSGLRSPNIALLTGMEQCDGEYIILTCGPEVMVPRDAVRGIMVAHRMRMTGGLEERRLGISCFCMGDVMQTQIDSVNWEESVDNLQGLKDFWIAPTSWGGTNKQYQANGGMLLAFSGGTKSYWDWIGGIRRTEKIGMNDRDLLARERFLSRGPTTVPYIHVYHQHHARAGKEWSELSTPAIVYTSEEQARLKC